MKPFIPYNEPFQNRDREPDAYENAFGDALEKAFASGLTTLPDLAQFMTDSAVPAPEGGWTEDSLAAELERLAASNTPALPSRSSC
ncbi:recombinase-like helix-turn-helix domain-containing protein [Asaia astilbis]|uniref:recombinase-like helix-turn-helix domain-containing protein n=1 Tax=Asaia astilbis TaxID=610244 RepID=UPI00047274A3|nr:recombinase-like helix-turn-helix domain-containing protein [Asaia astilbis]